MTTAYRGHGFFEYRRLSYFTFSYPYVDTALPRELVAQTNRYLSNVIEQDHRRVKQRVRPMLGFKPFDHAAPTISGSERVHQIKKNQFNLSALCLPPVHTPQVWEAILAA